MIDYEIKKKEIEEQVPVSITCDVCKKKYFYGNINDEMEIQEFHHINFTGGYSSVFGDMVTMQGQICQHCLNEKLGEYLVVTGDLLSHWTGVEEDEIDRLREEEE